MIYVSIYLCVRLFVCLFICFLVSLFITCTLRALNETDVATFLRVSGQYPELAAHEKILDNYIELLSKNKVSWWNRTFNETCMYVCFCDGINTYSSVLHFIFIHYIWWGFSTLNPICIYVCFCDGIGRLHSRLYAYIWCDLNP